MLACYKVRSANKTAKATKSGSTFFTQDRRLDCNREGEYFPFRSRYSYTRPSPTQILPFSQMGKNTITSRQHNSSQTLKHKESHQMKTIIIIYNQFIHISEARKEKGTEKEPKFFPISNQTQLHYLRHPHSIGRQRFLETSHNRTQISKS